MKHIKDRIRYVNDTPMVMAESRNDRFREILDTWIVNCRDVLKRWEDLFFIFKREN